MVTDKELGDWLHKHDLLMYSVAWDWFRRKGYEPSLDDVHDAVAEAVYRVWKYRARYVHDDTRPHPLETWVSMITRQCCYDLIARFKEHTVAYPVFARPAHEPSPETVYIQREEAIYQWEQLNDEQRRVIAMRYLGYDQNEMADELGCTVIRISSILSSARRKAIRYARGLKRKRGVRI